MTKIPTKNERVTTKTVQGLQCRHCGLGIAIGGDLETLPVTFEAQCPVCKKSEIYRSDEIQTLQVVQKQ